MDFIFREEKRQQWENIGCIIIVRVMFEPASAFNPFMPDGNKKGHTYLNKPAAFS